MNTLQLPWLELSIIIPLIGAALVRLFSNSAHARRFALATCAVTLLTASGEWIDFTNQGGFEAHDHWDVITYLFHQDVFVVDELSAPLLPLGALIYFVTVLATMKTKIVRFSLAWTLVSESLLLATFSCRQSWTLVACLILATIPPWVEMRNRGRCTRVYTIHMTGYVSLLLIGWGVHSWLAAAQGSIFVVGTLSAATLLRSGVIPVHCWMTDLLEKATFGTSILYLTPLTGAYAAMRLVLPIAPDWALQSIAILSLTTAAYAAGMALVQTEARRFFCYLFLSHSSLVLVGLELVTPIGLAGALSVWLSVGLALTGLALTLRAVESRIGRVSLKDYHGLFNQMPTLAGFFLLTGLASIGFPGTIGFVAMEMLIEGAVAISPIVGVIIVISAAMNSIAILFAFFRIFTGRLHSIAIPLHVRRPERLAVTILALLILGGGIWPQFGVASRYHAAVELRNHRPSILNTTKEKEPLETELHGH